MGWPMRLHLAVTLWLGLLHCSCLGLRIIHSPEYKCSQPGIQCTIKNSSCLDFSWLHPFKWTPSPPSSLKVKVGIEKNEEGHLVPVLQIRWEVAADSSILQLQGVEVSVLQANINRALCIQLQFGPFPQQLNLNNKPWEFFYNNFEVEPGQLYHVTVQHLPILGSKNSKDQDIQVPGCKDHIMNSTHSCYCEGYFWKPNIHVDRSDEYLVVNFDPRPDTCKYMVLVKNNKRLSPRNQEEIIQLQPDQCSRRVNVRFLDKASNPLCFYNIQIQPYIPTCENDCTRYQYNQSCSVIAEPTLPLGPGKRLHLCFITACLPLLLLFILFITSHLHNPEKWLGPVILPKVPDPVVKTVWLLYSADHRRYVDLVRKFACFMKVQWGLEVILDQFHVHEIGQMGAMPWLSKQKSKFQSVDGTVDGTILVLCSKGTQAKWGAMQIPDGPRVMLKEDIKNLFGDLFTPALNFIMTDFRDGAYDHYVVAFFGDLANDRHNIPSLFEVAPIYNLTQDLQDVYFRIQKKERHQPGVEYTILQDGVPAYESLKKALARCRSWEEKHGDWFQKQLSQEPVNYDSNEEESDIDEYLFSCRTEPVIIIPEPGIPSLNPILNEPDVAVTIDPVIIPIQPMFHTTPVLNEGDSTAQFMNFQLASEESGGASKLELVLDGDLSAETPSERDSPCQSDWSYSYSNSDNPMDAQHIEFLKAEQVRLFQQAQPGYIEDCRMEQNMEFPMMAMKVSLPEIDQGYQSFETGLDLEEFLRAEQVKLFQQNGGYMF